MRARIFLPQNPPCSPAPPGRIAGCWNMEPETAKIRDPLMGWTGADDMRSQIRLSFATREEAIAYAQAHEIPYDLEIPTTRVRKPKVYADNFRADRKENWTH